MPRDYKNRTSKRRTNRKKSTPGWVWLLAGLGIGLVVAVGSHFIDAAKVTSVLKPGDKQTDARSVKQQPATPPPPPPRRYDFYTMLPEMEVVVPEEEAAPQATVPPITNPGTYVLQVGSFRRYQEADKLKAELALAGFKAEIQKVTINNDATWHRVRLGPYNKLDDLNKVRGQLKAQGIKAILLKLKG
jgi:cell division protein FtsN